jgi:hypothetical protein
LRDVTQESQDNSDANDDYSVTPNLS